MPEQIGEKDLSRRETLLWLLLFFVLAVLQGHKLGIGDLATYLAFVWHKFDPALLANDLLIQTLGDHPVYIWDAAAFLMRFADIRTVFSGLLFLQIAVMMGAVLLFYRQFFGRDGGWRILMLTLVIGSFAAAMGRYGLNPYQYFHPNVLAVGLALFAYVLLDRGRRLAGAALCGAIFWIHPFTALYAGLFLGYCWLMELRKYSALRNIATVAVYLLVSAPSWLPVLWGMLEMPTEPFDMTLWLAIVQQRMQFSFFASQWVPDRWIHLALAMAGLWAFRHHPAFRRLLPLILGTLTALLLFVLADVFTVKFLLQLQLARCSYFLFIVLCAFIAHRIWTDNGSPRSPVALWMLIGYVFMIETVIDDRGYVLRLAVIALALLVPGFILWRKPQNWRAIYLAGGLLLVTVASADATATRYATIGRLFDTTHTTPWEDMQTWCAQNTPRDAVMMTPVYLEGFRSFSRRAIFGTYKDAAPHNYSKHTLFRWWERMQLLGITLPWDRAALPRLYHEHCFDAARQSGIRFVIIDKQYGPSPMNPRYENAGFALIDLHAQPAPAH